MEKKETKREGFPVIHERMPSRHTEKEDKDAAALFDFLFGKAPETGQGAGDASTGTSGGTGADAGRRQDVQEAPQKDAGGSGHSGVFLSEAGRKDGTKYQALREVFHQEVLRQEADAAAQAPGPVMEKVPEPAAEKVPELVMERASEPVKEPEPDAERVPEPASVPEPAADAVEKAPEPVKEPEPVMEKAPEPAVEPAPAETMTAGFGRNSVSAEAIRRSEEAEEPEEEVEVRTEGYLPPLPVNYTPNMQIALDDCVYSMFLGEICGADDPKKYEIYFMVAPFEIHENEPSCNILMYAFYRNQNYAITSPLTNNAKNSILCQIAEFQFLIRGSFKDGVWSSDIQLTGTSLRRNDVFEITKFCHHNAKHTGHEAGPAPRDSDKESGPSGNVTPRRGITSNDSSGIITYHHLTTGTGNKESPLQAGSPLASWVSDKESGPSDHLTTRNGHIRFTYEGYINHKEIPSVGSVDIFPMDSEGQTYVIVRCMEDFTDIFYTDDPVPVELKSDESIRILSVSVKEGIVTAELDEFTGGADGE